MPNLDWGKEPVRFFEIDQPFCNLVYGQTNEYGTCPAVLGTDGAHKCYNTRATTQKPDSYQPGTLTLRFAEAQEGLKQYGYVIPSMESLTTTPGAINLAGMDGNVSALGQREVVNVRFRDHKHSDLLVDKYRLERKTGAASSPSAPFDPYESGTFWAKWIARNPYHASYRCRVREGYIGQPLEQMRVRHYVIDRIEGPNDGEVRLVAKDLFSRIEAQKAVAPVASTGELSADITAAATAATLAPSGIGNAEYPGSGYIAIGDEVMSFTRSGDSLTLTRGQLDTVAAAHKEQDLVQLVLEFSAKKAHDIVYELLLNYTALETADLPKAEWDVKAAEMTDLYTARITTPIAVNELVGELAEQAGFSIFPDVSTGQIKFVPLRPVVASVLVDDRSIVVASEREPALRSLSVKRRSAERASQVWVHYGQKDPTKDLDDERNFHSRVLDKDISAEGPQQYGTPAIRKKFSRWIPQFGRQAAENTAARILAMFRDPPLEANFALHVSRQSEFSLAGVFNFETAEVQNERGVLLTSVLAVVEIERAETQIGLRGIAVKYSEPAGGGSGERVIHIENDAYNLNQRTIHDTIFAAPDGTETVRFIVDDGVVVGSTSTSSAAMRTGSWPSGTVLILENHGRIQGKGANGGAGGSSAGFGGPGPGDPGGNGGDALLVERGIVIDNTDGEIWGGGGGGGGGGSLASGYNGSGGGGGAGTNAGNGGPGGTGGGLAPGISGDPGTSTSGGVGGDDNYDPFLERLVGTGGNGGGPGLDGTAGQTEDLGAGGSGGTKGKYVSGNSLVTWTATGDLRGAVS